MALRDWTERHRGFWEFIKFNVLGNVSMIVRLALMWVGYVLREKVVEVVRHGPLSEPGASLDAPEAPDEPKATEPCADGSRYLLSSLHSGLLGVCEGCCLGKDASLAAAPLARPSRVATVYTNDPKQLREAIFADLCTLLRSPGLARDRAGSRVPRRQRPHGTRDARALGPEDHAAGAMTQPATHTSS